LHISEDRDVIYTEENYVSSKSSTINQIQGQSLDKMDCRKNAMDTIFTDNPIVKVDMK